MYLNSLPLTHTLSISQYCESEFIKFHFFLFIHFFYQLNSIDTHTTNKQKINTIIGTATKNMTEESDRIETAKRSDGKNVNDHEIEIARSVHVHENVINATKNAKNANRMCSEKETSKSRKNQSTVSFVQFMTMTRILFIANAIKAMTNVIVVGCVKFARLTPNRTGLLNVGQTD